MRFIIINLLPDPIAAAIRHIQESMAERTGAIECLRYPVHLTLRTGLLCPDRDAAGAAAAFLRHAAGSPFVHAEAERLSCMPYVDRNGVSRGFIGYAIHPSPELMGLHRYLLEYIAWMKGPQGGFEPHVSLCYHDLSPQAAIKLREEFKDTLGVAYPSWNIDNVSLWTETPGGWVENATAAISDPSSVL